MSRKKKNKRIDELCSLGSSLTMLITFYLIAKYHQYWQMILVGVFIILLCLLVAVFFISRLLKFARIEKAMNSQNYDSMTGEQFEEFCADILRGNNYQDVELTPATGDHGIDILAKKDGIKYAIQCKRYSKPVGNKAVQEAYSGRAIYKADVAVVMSNMDFTAQAIEDARKLKVELWGREKINTLQRYGNIVGTIENINRLKEGVNKNACSVKTEKVEEQPEDYEQSVSWIRELKNVGKKDKEEINEETVEITKNEPNLSVQTKVEAKEDNDICPMCGGRLVIRTAKRGPSVGSQFYGCSNYPNCKYTRNI